MTQIAIIDAHPILRRGLKFVLSTLFTGAEIVEGKNINEFRKSHPESLPDLIILAIGQNPVISKTYLISKVKRLYENTLLVLYDEEPDPFSVARYLKSGINGYVSKQGKVTELVACILDVVDGKHYVRI